MKSTLHQVEKRNGTLVAFDQERITFAVYKAAASVGGRNPQRAERLSDRVVSLLEERNTDGAPVPVETIQDTIEEVLITAGHVASARSFIVYRESRRAAREVGLGQSRAAHGPIPYRSLWETLVWNMTHGCHRVDALNRVIRTGGLPALIRAAEDRYSAEIEALADDVVRRSDTVRLVIVAGPSSSGKTTTTNRLSEALGRRGLELVAVNVDNYFRDLDHQPRDRRGDHDYETPEAIDLPLFNEHLEELLAGRPVDSPTFDFHTGRRTGETQRLQLEDGQLAIIDTLHGLSRPVTGKIPGERKYRIYIETLGQVRDADDRWVKWTDIRLLRRMVRDRIQRGKSPRETLEHWHYVRRAEKKHILPFLGDADFVIDTAFPYELAWYRPMTEDFFRAYLAETPPEGDAATRAARVYRLLTTILPMSDLTAIPDDSVLREFLGGGRYG
ncbi:MAG: ATP cone domain-containing protein [Pseudomonadota bacterium]